MSAKLIVSVWLVLVATLTGLTWVQHAKGDETIVAPPIGVILPPCGTEAAAIACPSAPATQYCTDFNGTSDAQCTADRESVTRIGDFGCASPLRAAQTACVPAMVGETGIAATTVCYVVYACRWSNATGSCGIGGTDNPVQRFYAPYKVTTPNCQ